jgi:hypothetical protein
MRRCWADVDHSKVQGRAFIIVDRSSVHHEWGRSKKLRRSNWRTSEFVRRLPRWIRDVASSTSVPRLDRGRSTAKPTYNLTTPLPLLDWASAEFATKFTEIRQDETNLRRLATGTWRSEVDRSLDPDRAHSARIPDLTSGTAEARHRNLQRWFVY